MHSIYYDGHTGPTPVQSSVFQNILQSHEHSRKRTVQNVATTQHQKKLSVPRRRPTITQHQKKISIQRLRRTMVVPGPSHSSGPNHRLDTSSKRQKKSQHHKETRRHCWGWCIGLHNNETLCPICGINTIVRTANAGWDCCHIVPESLDQHNAETDHFRLALLRVPGCRSCNNTMKQRNLIDYMYTARREKALCKLLWKWFNAHGSTIRKAHCNVMWKLVDAKFGQDHFPRGGGIRQWELIYPLLAHYQQKQLEKQMKRHAKKIRKLQSTSKQVMDGINTMGPLV